VRGGTAIAASPEFENLLDLPIVQQKNIISVTHDLPARISEVRKLISRRLASL
jgi:hypothetical protein